MRKLLILLLCVTTMLSLIVVLAGCEQGQNKTVTFAEVVTMPTAYLQDDGYIACDGDSVDLTGMTIELTYSDGTTEIIGNNNVMFYNIVTSDVNGQEMSQFQYQFAQTDSADGYLDTTYVYLSYEGYDLGSYQVVIYPPYIGSYRLIFMDGMSNITPTSTGWVYAEIDLYEFTIGPIDYDNRWCAIVEYSVTLVGNIYYFHLDGLNESVDPPTFDTTDNHLYFEVVYFIAQKVDDSMCMVTISVLQDDGSLLAAAYLAVDKGAVMDQAYLVDIDIDFSDISSYMYITLDGESFDWTLPITSDIEIVLSEIP